MPLIPKVRASAGICPISGASTVVKQLRQHGGLADVVALGRGQQGQPALAGEGLKVGQRLLGLGRLQLLAISLAELGPLVGVVGIPPAQLGRRRHVPAPLGQVGLLLADTARPHPIDEHPLAVVRSRIVVDPFYTHLGCHDFFITRWHGGRNNWIGMVGSRDQFLALYDDHTRTH